MYGWRNTEALVQPLLRWKNNKYHVFWVCVCRLIYPTCTGQAPYCHLWPALLYNIFPHVPVLLYIKCVTYVTYSSLFKKTKVYSTALLVYYTGALISPYPDQEGKKLKRHKILIFIYPIYNHNWRAISTIYIYNKPNIKRNILTIKQNTSGGRSG
jgi:hypothetical protein